MKRAAAGVALAVLVAVLATSGSAMAAPSCPALTYINSVSAARDDVSATPPRVSDAVRRLSDAIAGDPATAAVLQPISSDLQLAPPALADARSRLQQLAAVLALPSHATCDVDSGPALQDLHNVYASPVFAGLDQNPQPSLLQQIGAVLQSVVSHILNALGAAGSTLLGIVVLLLISALVVWRVRASLSGRGAQLRAEPAEAGDDPRLEWRRAELAATAGNHREAIRRAFRSALLEIAVHGALTVNAAWTTRDLLRAVRGDDELLAALSVAAADFDHAWYSGEAVSAADWQTARAHCDGVRRLARRPVRHAA